MYVRCCVMLWNVVRLQMVFWGLLYPCLDASNVMLMSVCGLPQELFVKAILKISSTACLVYTFKPWWCSYIMCCPKSNNMSQYIPSFFISFFQCISLIVLTALGIFFFWPKTLRSRQREMIWNLMLCKMGKKSRKMEKLLVVFCWSNISFIDIS